MCQYAGRDILAQTLLANTRPAFFCTAIWVRVPSIWESPLLEKIAVLGKTRIAQREISVEETRAPSIVKYADGAETRKYNQRFQYIDATLWRRGGPPKIRNYNVTSIYYVSAYGCTPKNTRELM